MLLCLVEVGMAQYTIQSNFSGATFFDNFDFWTSWDPTFGFVQYVDQSTAQSLGMINATEGGPANFGVEHQQVLDPYEVVLVQRNWVATDEVQSGLPIWGV